MLSHLTISTSEGLARLRNQEEYIGIITLFTVDGRIPSQLTVQTETINEIKRRHLGSKFEPLTVESLYYQEQLSAEPYRILLVNTESGRYSMYAFSSPSFISGILSGNKWFDTRVAIVNVWDGVGQPVFVY